VKARCKSTDLQWYSRPEMEFRILGPLDVVDGPRVVALPGAKHRALLAMLLLHANEVVSTERLTEALWDDEPPGTAQKALQVYVSQLRKVLDRERLLTKAPGYLIRVDADELDLTRFERLVREGMPREALELWRGPPLAEFTYADFAQSEIARLDELHLSCLEQRIDADLAAGRSAELVGELEALVANHPLRERPREQLMLALYRSGRQAEALTTYRDGRHALVEELGIEPGRSLRELEQAILRQDPALEVTPPPDDAAGGKAAPEPDARPLPTGTVTLFFADIEASTLLLQSLGAQYGAVLTRIRELVRAAIAEHGGSEVDWAGDGVFLAFERARDALAAAADVQQALEMEQWPESAQVRMAIGIHTGEPVRADDRYVGLDVHVAARICSAAHGGQVVVSQATRDVAIDASSDLSFRYLGDHRLKHVPTTQTLHQLVGPGLDEDFPPLSALGGSSLPALHHRLVGRRADLAAAQALLARSDIRLVTIAGPGGAGKSRLALEAASEAALHRPVHLVGLAPISDAALVPAAIANVVGVRESRGTPLTSLLAEALEGTGALLVLDNMEHLPGATADIAALLDRASDLDILATSRSPLRLRGEHVVPLSSLPTEDATTLFFELAEARGVQLDDESLAIVEEICRRLDGLPLAIELVTARLVLLSPRQLLAALDDGLALAMEGSPDFPERQRTLHATLGWSYALLTIDQRQLHGQLAVFAGGSALEDATAVAGSAPRVIADLEVLVSANLLRREAGDGLVRLSMLETVREDAVGRLAAAGKLDECRRRHAEHFLRFAERAEEGLAGAEQTDWLDRVEDELDNVRAALDWCLASGRAADALDAVSSLGRFWRAHGHASEARRVLARGLDQPADLPPEVRARALWTAAHEAMAQSDYLAAIPALEEALSLFRGLGDSRHAVFALCEIARALSSRDELDRAYEAGQSALELAESSGDDRACSAALDTLAMVAGYSERHKLAQEYSERSLALRRSLGDAILITSSTNTLGMAAMRAGDLDTAERAFTECLELARGLGEQLYVAAALCGLGEIALGRNLPQVADDHLVEALTLYTELGDERLRAECLHALGGVAAADGLPLDAARLWGAADALRERSGAVRTPEERAVDERFGAAVALAENADALARARAEGLVLQNDELDVLVESLKNASLATSVATNGGNSERSR
jgi:predicted ATPase/DNA-binding SARP family transcriptional activator